MPVLAEEPARAKKKAPTATKINTVKAPKREPQEDKLKPKLKSKPESSSAKDDDDDGEEESDKAVSNLKKPMYVSIGKKYKMSDQDIEKLSY